MIYGILDKSYIPKNRIDDYNRIIDLINYYKNKKRTKYTSMYISDKIIKLLNKRDKVYDEIFAYSFCKSHNKKEYDLHGALSYQIYDILDALFDYNTSSFEIITGNGNVVKPKVIKYLKYFNIKYTFTNSGKIKICVK